MLWILRNQNRIIVINYVNINITVDYYISIYCTTYIHYISALIY